MVSIFPLFYYKIFHPRDEARESHLSPPKKSLTTRLNSAARSHMGLCPAPRTTLNSEPGSAWCSARPSETGSSISCSPHTISVRAAICARLAVDVGPVDGKGSPQQRQRTGAQRVADQHGQKIQRHVHQRGQQAQRAADDVPPGGQRPRHPPAPGGPPAPAAGPPAPPPPTRPSNDPPGGNAPVVRLSIQAAIRPAVSARIKGCPRLRPKPIRSIT